MLPAVVLSPVLVGLPAVLATPARVPVEVSQGSSFSFIPAVIEKAYDYGHQIAQWTMGKTEDSPGVLSVALDSAAHCVPRHPHHPQERVVVNKTIYEVLSGEHRFSKLFKLVNLNNATIDLLNDSSSDITFFAPPDSAFPRRRHGRHHSNAFLSEPDNALGQPDDPAEWSLMDVLDEVDSLDALDEDDDKKERRRKIIKYIVGAVLSYHVIPQPFDIVALAKNTTYGSNLTLPEGSLDGEPLRLRVGRAPLSPALSVNLFSRLAGPEIVTSNGIIHTVTLPLLPPPAIFTGQFNVPSVFSIATSALQRVGLTDEVDYVYVPPHDDQDEGRTVGASTVTFFAPSNRAFQRLPARLRLFLFSPFGHRALKKLLQYHIVPSHTIHSDYIHNATSKLSMQQLGGAFAQVPERNILAAYPDNVYAERQQMAYTFAMERPAMEAQVVGRSKFRAAYVERSSQAPRPVEHMETPRRRPTPPEVEYNVTVVVPTLLENRTHTIVVTKFVERKPIPGFPRLPISGAERTRVTVSGGRVAIADIPARNGAVHIIDQLLNPLRSHKHHEDAHEQENVCQMQASEWEDWEEWLPQWAEEA